MRYQRLLVSLVDLLVSLEQILVKLGDLLVKIVYGCQIWK
ncbi:hypothetical protein J2Y73_003656 [Peribacillus frigoritolerans]|nr:hypothetical protein [Peribacillus frigoritolerans]